MSKFPMKVLVACEYSGVVRDAFNLAGHDASSCDFLPSETDGEHYQGDILKLLRRADKYDLIILHPPCTALCVAGNASYADSQERRLAIQWTYFLWWCARQRASRVALENPVGVLSTWWRKPDQYIQPWQFGHGETKKTGWWLHGLPKLTPTDIVEGREQRIWKMSPSPDRSKERSRFYPGIAKAMVQQWGTA